MRCYGRWRTWWRSRGTRRRSSKRCLFGGSDGCRWCTSSPCCTFAGLKRGCPKAIARWSPAIIGGVRDLFTVQKLGEVTIESKCEACLHVVRDKQRNATHMARHVFYCPSTSYSQTVLAQTSSKSLQNLNAPVPPRKPHPASNAAIILGHRLGTCFPSAPELRDACAFSSAPLEVSHKKNSLASFVDRISAVYVEDIRRLILRFFVAINISFFDC